MTNDKCINIYGDPIVLHYPYKLFSTIYTVFEKQAIDTKRYFILNKRH